LDDDVEVFTGRQGRLEEGNDRGKERYIPDY
jgi:hypothetical protein